MMLNRFILMVWLVSSASLVGAQCTLSDDDVIVENGIITSCSYDFAIKDIIIPDTLDDQLVTGIADRESGHGVFHERGITSVSLPSSLVFIGGYAFYNNSIAKLSLDSCRSLESIGNYAFRLNNIPELDLSSCVNLKSIDAWAFNFNSIRSLNLDSCHFLESIGDGAFMENNITELELSPCINLKWIAKSAFSHNAISHLNLTSCKALESIGHNAFYGNAITVLDLSPCVNLKSIDVAAFKLNSIVSLNLDSCIALEYIGAGAFSSNNITEFALPSSPLSISYGWFGSDGIYYSAGDTVTDLSRYYCITIPHVLTDEDVDVQGGVIQSCTGSFQGKTLIIPDTLDGQCVKGVAYDRYWEYGVFDTKGIVGLKLPSSIKYIGAYAFTGNQLTNIDFSSCQSLTTIGRNAFSSYRTDIIDLSSCSSLLSVEKYAFSVPNQKALILPVNTEYEENGWKDGEGNLHNGGDTITMSVANYYVPVSYTLTDDDVSVRDGILESCSYDFSIRNVNIPDTLDGLAVRVIRGLGPSTSHPYSLPFPERGIISVTLPSTLRSIGSQAFCGNDIEHIVLPVNPEFSENGWKASRGKTYNGGDTIHLAFSGPYSYIPYSEEFYIPGRYTITDSDVHIVDGIIKSVSCGIGFREIVIPETLQGQTVIGIDSLDPNCYYCGVFKYMELQSVEFPSTLEHIGDYAFSSNPIDTLNLDSCKALKSIGTGAFMNSNISSFILPVNPLSELYGWYSSAGHYYTGGDTVDDLSSQYYIPIPYTLTDEDVTVVDGIITSCSYDFAIKDIIIPDTLEGQLITGIADRGNYSGVFFERGITSVSLPSSLVFIGDYAFGHNSIARLYLDSCRSLESIGKFAFLSNRIPELDLSSCVNLKSIGARAFFHNSITILNLDSCHFLESIGDGAFMENNITELELSPCINLKWILQNAFSHNAISHLNLTSCKALESIGPGAFSGNAITALDLSSCTSLLSIDIFAFSSGCLDEIVLPSNSEYSEYGWKDRNGNTYYGGDTVQYTGSLYYVPVSYTLTDDDVSVRDGILESCSYYFSIRNTIIPDTLDGQAVTVIKGLGATTSSLYSLPFYDRGIIGVTLPSTLRSIKCQAFDRNYIEHIVLPVNPEYSENGWKTNSGKTYNGGDTIHLAFSDPYSTIPNFEEFYIPGRYTITDSDVHIVDGLIKSVSRGIGFIEIIIPDTLQGQKVVGIDSPDPEDCDFCGVFNYFELISVDFPSSLEFIGEWAFHGNIILNPDLSSCPNLKSIGDYAFYGNRVIELDLRSCSNLTSIGSHAFYCTGLQNINLDSCKSLTYIGDRAFYDLRNVGPGFRLPEVDIRGYVFDKWIDENGNYFEGNEETWDLSTYYSVILIKAYTATFIIQDQNGPITDAVIRLSENGNEITDSTGLASFDNVIPEDSIRFIVTANGYENISGFLTVSDTNVHVVVTLDLLKYSVEFEVNDGVDPVSGATIKLSGYTSQTTDSKGQATFSEIVPEDDIDYTVSANGFEDVSGFVSVVDMDVEERVIVIMISGLQDQDWERFWLYPNPANNLVYMHLPESGILTINQVNGSLVLQERVLKGRSEIDVSDFEPGLYLFQVRADTDLYSRMIIVK